MPDFGAGQPNANRLDASQFSVTRPGVNRLRADRLSVPRGTIVQRVEGQGGGTSN